MAAPVRNSAYVYALFDGDAVAYIGKGTGRRLKNQERIHRLSGRVLKEFKTESEAFAYERQMISELKPLLNRCPGGNGGRVRVRRRAAKTRLERLWDQIGGRAVSARMLLAVKHRRPELVATDWNTLRKAARLDVVGPSGAPVNPFSLQ